MTYPAWAECFRSPFVGMTGAGVPRRLHTRACTTTTQAVNVRTCYTARRQLSLVSWCMCRARFFVYSLITHLHLPTSRSPQKIYRPLDASSWRARRALHPPGRELTAGSVYVPTQVGPRSSGMELRPSTSAGCVFFLRTTHRGRCNHFDGLQLSRSRGTAAGYTGPCVPSSSSPATL